MDSKRWFEAKAQDEKIAALTADLAAMTEARDAAVVALYEAIVGHNAQRAEIVLTADSLEAETARADAAEVKLEQAEERAAELENALEQACVECPLNW